MTTTEETNSECPEKNPDLEGFDLEALSGLAAYSDGSGGGIDGIAWEMGRLRELRERIDLLDAFARKHQMLLARLSWNFDATAIHPEDKDLESMPFVPEIRICSAAYDNRRDVTGRDIAALWSDARWRRSRPRWGGDTVRDYTADVDGVLVRIEGAERKPKPKKVDRFGPCGPIKL